MTINKHSLPKRVISLLLAVAIMIGFVPIIDIDLTAFAMTSGKVTLTDDAPQSGENWVWDNENHTLSLYNTIFNDGTTIDSAIEYTGNETLIINQTGINGIMITSSNDISVIKAKKIKVIGSGILETYQSGGAIFDAQELEITSGYIRSNNALSLNKRQGNVTTVSNCVLDIPQAEIMAYAQSDGTAGFIMKSGYVNCYALMSQYYSKPVPEGLQDYEYKAAEIQSGYLNVYMINGNLNTWGYAYIELGKAVVKAVSLEQNAAFCQNRSATNETALVNSTLIYQIDQSGEYKDFFQSASKGTTSGADYIFYQSNDIPHAMYYGDDTTLTSTTTLSEIGTIVCPDTLGLTAIDNIPEGVTIYCGETLTCSGTINGCLIGGQKLWLGSADSDTTVGGTGRIYVNSVFKLTGDTTIAKGGAVTITTAPTLDSKQLTINGDLTVYSTDSGAIFNENNTNLTIGENAQIVAATANGTIFETSDVYSIIYSKAKYAGRIFYGVDSTKSSSGEINLEFPAPYTATVLYIGSAFDTQLDCTDSHAEFYYNLKNSYDAWYKLECTRPFDEDYRDLTVTITKDSNNEEVTSHFDIIKSSTGYSNGVKVEIRNKDLDVNSGDTFTVSFTKDGFTHEQTLTAVAPDFTLDFTKDANPASPATPVWNYCGAFYGTSNTCYSATIGDKKVWEWHPNGAEGYTGKVLVLNGLEIETTAQNAIIVPADTTIVVKGSSNVHSKNTAISCKGNVTIAGAGSNSILTANSDNSVPDYYAAIQSSGDITIKNISLHTSMGECDYSDIGYGASEYSGTWKSYGIYGINVHLIDVSGECKADDATEDNGDNDSAAICALSTIFIDRSCALTLTAYTYALESATLKSAEVENLVGAYNSDNTATYSAADINSAIGTNNVVSGITIIRTFSHANSVNYNTKSNVTVTIAENDKQGGQITCSAENGTPAYTPSTTEPDTIKVTRGADLTIVFTANQGYYIKTLTVGGVNWVENGRLKGSNLYAYGYDETTGLIIAADVLFRNIQDNVQISVEYAAIPTSDPPQSSTPHTAPLPVLDGTGYSYARMAEVLATYKTGSTATIETNGNYDVPEAVIKAIANGKLKVTIIMDSVTSRYIDGADIETVKSVDADVRRTYSLDTDELSGNEAMQLILFKFDVLSDLIIDLNAKNAGLFANLYKYTNGEFEFADCAKINKDGKAVFEDYTTSGTYAIMLSEYSGLLGDMNNDGKLNAADATAILKYVVGLDDNSKRNLPVADFDGNGKINARDAVMVLKRVVGLI